MDTCLSRVREGKAARERREMGTALNILTPTEAEVSRRLASPYDHTGYGDSFTFLNRELSTNNKKRGKSQVQAFSSDQAPSRPDPGQQALTPSGQKEGHRSSAKDDTNRSKSPTGVMATLLSTMSRRNRVGPESEAVAKASREFESLTTEAEKYAVLKTIRQLSCPMATKRQLMEKLMEGPVMESHGMKQLKFENKKRWNRVKEGWNNFKYALEPWRSALRKIEGNHGSGVVSYFVFLRYLLLVNFCMFLLTMFVWVPEALTSSTPLVASSTAETCTAAYTVNVSSDAFTLILDFFQGSGWMEQTAVFYGYYSGNGLEGTDYKLSLAYILVCIACLLSSLMLMGRHVAASFRESILNSGDGTTEFCNKVFGSWDYTLSDSASAAIKGKSVRIELLSDINEQKFLTEREERLKVRSKKCKLYGIRILINCFIVCVLGASAYLIYYVTTFSTEYVSENAEVSGTEKVLLKLLVQFLPAITMAVLNGALPIVFQKVVVGEEYTTAFVIKITLIRTVFLRLASLTVLMITLYTEVTCSTRDACMTTRSPCNVITCWETYVGQQLYKLIIMDFLIVFVKTLLVELPRRLFYEKCSCGLMQKVGPPEFDIPSNVLDLVYSQCLYWLSLSFAPLTPGFSVIKVIATFYLKMLSALKACPPAEQPYRASRTNTFFMFILLVAFFLCSVPIGYTLYSLEPSHGCGPFRTYTHMYDAITTTVDNWPSTARSIYELIISPAVTAPLIIFLCLLIYYCSVLASAHKTTSDMFREQVVMEGRDKQFLLLKVKELGGDSNPLPRKPHKNPPPGINRLQNAKQANGGAGGKGGRANSNLSPSQQANNQNSQPPAAYEGVGSKGNPTSPHMPVDDDGW